jgi:hypothetical protein
VKRIGVITVLLALFFNTVGFYLYYSAAMYRIKTHWRTQLNELPKEKLTCLLLDIDVYKDAVVEDDELQINGHMFDVVHAEVTQDKVQVYGAYDKEEDSLIAQLHECFSKPEDFRNFCNAINDFLTLVYVVPSQCEFPIAVLSKSSFSFSYRLLLYEVHRSISPPPPDPRSGETFQR